jgi:hypothetical protein
VADPKKDFAKLVAGKFEVLARLDNPDPKKQ